MKRWDELGRSFGFNILFPRICLYGLLPSLILLGPGNIAWLAYWSPACDWTVLTLFGSLFLLNVAANLAISRYLRLQQIAASPYDYTQEYDLFAFTPYFRIQVTDRAAFRRSIKSLRSEHRGKAIWLWLWLDDLLLVPALLMLGVWLLWTAAGWLKRRFKLRQQPSML